MKIADQPEFKSKPRPLTCGPETTLREAAQMMAKANYGSIVIVSPDDKVLGLLTERDYLNRVVAGSIDPDGTKVGDLMTAEVRVAKASDDLLEWLRIMSNERFRRLPVVDEEGKLVNLVTQGDFVSYTWPDLINQAKTFVQSTAGSNSQLLLIGGGVLFYSLLLVFLLKAV
ncbi:MAG: CBS domain-containing protein [Pseudomonadota bacterium]